MVHITRSDWNWWAYWTKHTSTHLASDSSVQGKEPLMLGSADDGVLPSSSSMKSRWFCDRSHRLLNLMPYICPIWTFVFNPFIQDLQFVYVDFCYSLHACSSGWGGKPQVSTMCKLPPIRPSIAACGFACSAVTCTMTCATVTSSCAALVQAWGVLKPEGCCKSPTEQSRIPSFFWNPEGIWNRFLSLCVRIIK